MNGATAPVYARRALVVCFLVALCEGIDLQAAGVAAGGISREFLPTVAQKGLFFGASTFGLFLGALLGGWIADAIGRKKVLVASIAAFGAFSILTSLAPDMTLLTVARLLTGLGLGGALPNLIAVAAEASAPERRSASIVAMYVGMPLGGVIASAIILFVDVTQWRTVFIAGGIAPLLTVPLMVAFMPATMPAGSHGGGSTVVSAEALRELFGDGRAPRTLLLWLACFLALLILYLFLNWLPTLLQGIGLSGAEAAGAQIGFNLGGVVCSLTIARLLDSRFRLAAIVATFIAVPVALLGLADLAAHPGAVWVLTLLLGAGVVSTQGILYGIAADCYAAAHRGAGVGTAVALGRVGSFVGPLLAAVLVGAGRTPAQVLTGMLPIVALCAAAVIYLGRRRPVSARS